MTRFYLIFFQRVNVHSLWSNVKKLSVLFWSLISYILVAYIHPELITSLEEIVKNIGELYPVWEVQCLNHLVFHLFKNINWETFIFSNISLFFLNIIVSLFIWDLFIFRCRKFLLLFKILGAITKHFLDLKIIIFLWHGSRASK